MDQNLRQILLNTISADNNIKNESEKQLNEVGKNPECMSIIQNVLMKDPNALLKQISSLYFVNALKKHWKENEMKEFVHSIENSILDLLASNEEQRPYLDIIQIVFDCSEDTKFTAVFNRLPYFLNSTERRQNIAALLLIGGIFKNDNIRYNLEGSLSSVFDTNGDAFTRVFSESLRTSDFEVSKMCMKIVARVYSYYSIPAYLNNKEVFKNYVFAAIEVSKIPYSYDENVSKLRKWGIFFLYKSVNKGFKKYFKNNEFVEFIKNDGIIKVLVERFFSIVADYAGQKPMHPRVLSLMCEFFVVLSENKNTRVVIKENYGFLLSNFILPVQSYKDKTKELFEYDDQKYLRMRYNFISSGLQSEALSLFSSILSCDKGVKADVLGTLIGFLRNKEETSYRYGIIGLLANEQRAMVKTMGKEGYENFITTEVFDGLESKHDFQQNSHYFRVRDDYRQADSRS